MGARKCQHCKGEIGRQKRANAIFCCERCRRSAAYSSRGKEVKRAWARRNYDKVLAARRRETERRRAAAASRPAKSCVQCGNRIVGRRPDAKWCSKMCRDKADYRRHREKRNAYTREWQKKNPEKFRVYLIRSEARRRANGKLGAYRRAYYAKNRELLNERHRKWKRENPEVVKRSSKRWRMDNPELVRAYNRKKYQKNRAAIIAKVAAKRTKASRAAEGKRRYWRYLNRERIKNLRYRLRRQFGRNPPEWLIEARIQALMLKWEERAARKAHS